VHWRVRVRPEAELDLLFAAGWYEAQRSGLGAEFLEEMAVLMRSLASNARIYAEVFDGVRRVIARRFPYAVAYRIVDDEVVVLSVLHLRRNRRR
jgi:toxin ParE1/3/4